MFSIVTNNNHIAQCVYARYTYNLRIDIYLEYLIFLYYINGVDYIIFLHFLC